MLPERIADMTVKELERLIERVVEEKLQSHQSSRRPVEDVLAEMWNTIWIPPPGTKSSLEMLREDRSCSSVSHI